MKAKKLTFRLATRKEISLIDHFLAENWHVSLEKLLNLIFKKNINLRIYVFEGYFNEVYSIDTVFENIISKLQEKGKHPYALGFHLGRLRKNKFVPSLELGYVASKETNACIIVNSHGEKVFLYGRNLLSDSIVDIKASIKRNQIVIVLNEDEEYVGIGRALTDIVKKNNRVLSKKTGFVVKNIIDLGWYLRKGG